MQLPAIASRCAVAAIASISTFATAVPSYTATGAAATIASAVGTAPDAALRVVQAWHL